MSPPPNKGRGGWCERFIKACKSTFGKLDQGQNSSQFMSLKTVLFVGFPMSISWGNFHNIVSDQLLDGKGKMFLILDGVNNLYLPFTSSEFSFLKWKTFKEISLGYYKHHTAPSL